jgi:4-hydroxy-3-polyprenylbenzoate decarboxylase
MSELTFAGALAGHRIPLIQQRGHLPIYADADFCITGYVDPSAAKKLEGPFGDHLGYYSLAHEFPVLKVERVYHRPDAVWPFTVVGRPPQEDTVFGQLIHGLTGPAIPSALPGVRAVHAVDAAGVHPLLLAIGSERYWPFAESQRPQELLTQANAILGQGQLSLAKFLLIANHADDPHLDVYDVASFLRHILERADWTRDLHFQTETTIDTLDYSGGALNAGSKVVIAAVGPKRFELAMELPGEMPLTDGLRNPRVVLPGVLAIEGPRHGDSPNPQSVFRNPHSAAHFRWIVVVDDSQFVAESLRNFLWVTFTRANPAADIHGIEPFVRDKHWGCRGPLVIDARTKPHHAPPLVEDPAVTRRVEALAAPGGPLHGIL